MNLAQKNNNLYKIEAEKTINCPQCGDGLDILFKWTKLVACPSCKSTIFLEDDGTLKIGEESTLSPEPSLIRLRDPITIDNRNFLPIGKIRYSYGRGFWEEWFLKNERGEAYWLSIDEGDFVLQKKANVKLPFDTPLSVHVGQKYGNYLVTERGTGKCVGFEGELPEPIKLEQSHFYLHLSQGGGKLLTVEATARETTTFVGEWIDPLSIKRVYA
jgi:ribosomal protein S27AE